MLLPGGIESKTIFKRAIIPVATAIPNIPEIIVKNMDSDKICPRIAPGVAPKALRIPISFVRSLTTISIIFEIPITPEIKTNVPTK
ncbi:hypothetical protein D3C87_1273460 [compost metagenome]